MSLSAKLAWSSNATKELMVDFSCCYWESVSVIQYANEPGSLLSAVMV